MTGHNPSPLVIADTFYNVYPGQKTKQVIEKCSELVKKSITQYINELLNNKLKATIATTYTEDLANFKDKSSEATDKFKN
jgi:hypothetical protein